MSEEKMPTTIFVDNGDKVDDVIYGNENKDVYKIDGIIIATKEDPETHEKKITKTYKITKIDVKKGEVGTDVLEVRCVRIG